MLVFLNRVKGGLIAKIPFKQRFKKKKKKKKQTKQLFGRKAPMQKEKKIQSTRGRNVVDESEIY